MYEIKRISGKYLAIDKTNRSDMYVVPDDVVIDIVRRGIDKRNISDDLFFRIRQKESGIVPYKLFDDLNKEELYETRKVIETSNRKMHILREKKKKGKSVRVNRDKSSNRIKYENKVIDEKKKNVIKCATIKVATAVTAGILAVTAVGGFFKNKSKSDSDNGYSIEKNIDTNNGYHDEKENGIESDYVNESITSNEVNNEDIILEEEPDDLDNQEESTEYYYNLDGEVDRQNWKNAMKHENEFKEAEKKFGIDYRLLMAIACQESSGIHNPNDSKYATGIMKIQNVHKGEHATFVNNITKRNDSIDINEENLKNAQSNIDIGAALFQHCLYLAYEKGYENGILAKEEIIPAALYGYNNGATALVKMLNAYKKSNEESYNSFVRTIISANIDNENLVWHLKYPALVFNERSDDDVEFWAKYVKEKKEDTFKTKPVNESKMYSASMKR